MNWVGALLVVVSSYFFGVLLCAEEKKKPIALASVLELLKFMRRKMIEGRLPLTQVFESFENKFLEQTGFLSVLREGNGALNLRFSKGLELLPIAESVKNELKSFSADLGLISLQEQERKLNFAIAYLSETLSEATAALPAKQKSIKAVCTLVGAGAAIILI